LPWYFLLDFGIGLIYAQEIVRSGSERERICRTQIFYDSLLVRILPLSLGAALLFALFIFTLWRPWPGISTSDLTLGLLIVTVIGTCTGLINARVRMSICLGNAQRLQVSLASSWIILALILSKGSAIFGKDWSILTALSIVMLGQAGALFSVVGRWRDDPSTTFMLARDWLRQNTRNLGNSLGYSFFTVCFLQIDSIIIPECCKVTEIAKYSLLMKLALGWHVCYIQVLQHIQGDMALNHARKGGFVPLSSALRVIGYGILASVAVMLGLEFFWGRLSSVLNVQGSIPLGFLEVAALVTYLSSRCALDYLNLLFQTIGDLSYARQVAIFQALLTAPVIAMCALRGATLAIAGFGAVIWVTGVLPLLYFAFKSGTLRREGT